MYYDSHTHLNDDKLYPQRQTYLQHFVDGWWVWLVNIWVDEQRSQKAIDIAVQSQKLFPDIYVKAAIGHHPSEVCFGKIQNEQDIQSTIQKLQNLYEQYSDHIVAIGECGIDTHYEGDPHLDLQKELFRQQCELAKSLNLPIVIHSRDDFAATFDVVKNYADQKIYFHCRGYGPDEIKILQDTFAQLRIGYCGNISYPKAQTLRDSLYATRPESIVLETDAPYLAPQQLRWQINEPANVVHIYEYVASILDISLQNLQQAVAHNIKNLYNT